MRATLVSVFIAFSWQDSPGEAQPLFQGKPISFWVSELQGEKSSIERKLESLTALGKLWPRGKPYLEKAALEGNLELRQAAIKIIGDQGKPGIPSLEKIAKSDVRGSRHLALKVLSNMGEEAVLALPELISLTSHFDPETSVLAITVIQKIGPKAYPALPALIRNYRSMEREIYTASFQAMASICNWAKGSTDKPVFDAALEFLFKKGKDGVAPLIEATRDKEKSIRLKAVRHLGDLGPVAKPALKRLQELLRDEEAEIVDAAFEAIKKIDPKSFPK